MINQFHYNWKFINISSGKTTFTFQGLVFLYFMYWYPKKYMPCIFNVDLNVFFFQKYS